LFSKPAPDKPFCVNKRSADLPIRVLPLGGLGEIGMNCMLIGHHDRYVMVDCGIQFPDPWEIGADRKLVDLDMLGDYADRIEAVLITHGHEDHIGGLPWALPYLDASVRIFASRFTERLIEKRLGEHNSWDAARIVNYEAGETFRAGPFEVEAVRVTHSLPDCCSLALKCEDGVVVHTGDWKIDEQPMDGEHFDREAFKRIGDEGVVCLLSDSTNVMVPGWTRSERAVAQSLLETIDGYPGRIICTQFASNMHRVQALVEAAAATDRKIVFAGRSLHRYLKAAATCGRAPIDPGKIVDIDNVDHLPDHRVLVVSTGSQGERNSVLGRASEGGHPRLRLRKGDLVLHSARIIPGNEAQTYQMFNNIALCGAELIYGRNTGIHASGHARQDELAEMFRLLRPDHLIPVHGEYTFLKRHAAHAESLGVTATIVRNGELMGIGRTEESGTRVRAVDYEVPTIYYNDGHATGDYDQMLMTERRRVAWNGVVAVRLDFARDAAGRATAVECQVESRALWLGSDEALMERVCRTAVEAVSSCPPKTPLKEMEEAVRVCIRRLCRKEVGRKPDVMILAQDRGYGASKAV